MRNRKLRFWTAEGVKERAGTEAEDTVERRDSKRGLLVARRKKETEFGRSL